MSGPHLHSSTASKAFSFKSANRGRRHAHAPQDLGDVLDPPDGDPGQVHLNHGLLDGRPLALAPLDDGGGESHVLELGHLEGHLAQVGRETALVVAGAVGLTIDGAFVAVGFDKTVSLLPGKGIEDVFFDGLADESFKLATHGGLVKCYDGIGY